MRLLLAALVVFVSLTVSTAASARSENRWPAVQEHAFLDNCYATSGGKIAACRCSLRWLEKRYTYRQIAAIFLHDQARMYRILKRATLACRR